MLQSVLNTPLINCHLVLTLKLQISLKLLSFVFWLKKTLTLLTILVKSKQYKTESDIGKYITDKVKEHAEISSSTSSSFQFL